MIRQRVGVNFMGSGTCHVNSLGRIAHTHTHTPPGPHLHSEIQNRVLSRHLRICPPRQADFPIPPTSPFDMSDTDNSHQIFTAGFQRTPDGLDTIVRNGSFFFSGAKPCRYVVSNTIIVNNHPAGYRRSSTAPTGSQFLLCHMGTSMHTPLYQLN
jgi:hypothetical protein